jgi:hypothetical protein
MRSFFETEVIGPEEAADAVAAHDKLAVRVQRGGGVDCLLCPLCGGEYLHQGDVVAHHAQREDADGHVMVFQGGGKGAFREAKRAEFFGRRNDLSITFGCEHCGPRIARLTIYQHKGVTLLQWTLLPRHHDDPEGP